MPLVLSKSARPNRRHLRAATLVAAFSAVLLAGLSLPLRTAEGASTGTTQLFTPAAGGDSAGAGKTIGDFVSTFDGLDTYYSYFVEVPASLSHLVIQIFDADSANTTETGGRDRARTNNSNAANTHYRLFEHPNIKLGRDEKFFLAPFYKIRNLPYLALYDKKGNLITTFEGTQKVETIVKAFQQKASED